MGSEKQTVSKNGGRHLKLNIGLIVFIGIFIYLIAIGLSYLMRNHISFYEVQQGWIVDSDTFTGFILRNEAVVNTGQSGYINYFVNDGAMVARGQCLHGHYQCRQQCTGNSRWISIDVE